MVDIKCYERLMLGEPYCEMSLAIIDILLPDDFVSIDWSLLETVYIAERFDLISDGIYSAHIRMANPLLEMVNDHIDELVHFKPEEHKAIISKIKAKLHRILTAIN